MEFLTATERTSEAEDGEFAAVHEEPEHHDDSDEGDAEEDAWLQMEVMRLTTQEAENQDGDAYKPQLMDEHAMQSLRRELRTSEARVERDGHMREYVPRKPSTASVLLASSRQHRRFRGSHQALQPTEDVLSDDDDQQLSPEDRRRKREYAKALKDEVYQFSKLYEQYEDTKRLLINHLDVICSTKPSERMSGADAYEALEELLAFATKCKSNI